VQKRRGGFLRRALSNSGIFHFLMPVVIMIVVVPIALLMPAPLVFIPPPVSVFPAPFSCLAELVPLVVRLPAVVTVLFDRAIQLVVRMSQSSLAIVACIRSRRSCH
jgi:hypothetical protein